MDYEQLLNQFEEGQINELRLILPKVRTSNKHSFSDMLRNQITSHALIQKLYDIYIEGGITEKFYYFAKEILDSYKEV